MLHKLILTYFHLINLIILTNMFFLLLAHKLSLLGRTFLDLYRNTFAIVFHNELSCGMANFESLGSFIDSEVILHNQLNQLFLSLSWGKIYFGGDESVILLGFFGVVIILVFLPLWHATCYNYLKLQKHWRVFSTNFYFYMICRMVF